jgi:hypothetical protein
MFVYYKKAQGGFSPALCDLQADFLTASLLQVNAPGYRVREHVVTFPGVLELSRHHVIAFIAGPSRHTRICLLHALLLCGRFQQHLHGNCSSCECADEAGYRIQCHFLTHILHAQV